MTLSTMQLKPARAPRIFVAEDDASVLELVVTRLSLAGFEVRFAKNGWMAYEQMQSFKPNGVVLDIMMPGMDGFGVLASMRNNKALAKTPVLMLTARGALDDVRKALKLGAQDYLTKPFNDQELIARVKRLVRPPHPAAATSAQPAAAPQPAAPPAAAPPAAARPAATAGPEDDGALLI